MTKPESKVEAVVNAVINKGLEGLSTVIAKSTGTESAQSDPKWFSEADFSRVTHRLVNGMPERLVGPARAFQPALEAKAASGLRNICDEEAARRMESAKRWALATAALMGGFVLAGDSVPRVARAAVGTPFGISIGLAASAKTGICGISHKGMWVCVGLRCALSS
jgi:hypothetical protein